MEGTASHFPIVVPLSLNLVFKNYKYYVLVLLSSPIIVLKELSYLHDSALSFNVISAGYLVMLKFFVIPPLDLVLYLLSYILAGTLTSTSKYVTCFIQ